MIPYTVGKFCLEETACKEGKVLAIELKCSSIWGTTPRKII